MIRTKVYYQIEYEDKLRSIRDISQEHNTYTNKIRRELLEFGFELRDKSAAQKAALQTGRHKHPTKGKSRPLEVKQKISSAVAEYRQNAKTKEV